MRHPRECYRADTKILVIQLAPLGLTSHTHSLLLCWELLRGVVKVRRASLLVLVLVYRRHATTVGVKILCLVEGGPSRVV